MIRGAVFDDWWPTGAKRQYTPPDVGDLVAWQHVVWRIIEVRPVPEDRWTDEQREFHDRRLGSTPEKRWQIGAVPVVVVVRPAVISPDDPKARRHDKHLGSRGPQPVWWVYRDEHYPVCGTCSEPMPCREQLGARVAAQAMADMARWEQPGVCPSCRELVTTRQKSWTCPDNLEIPGGPPVTFHIGRRGCLWDAASYENRWLAADPARAVVVPRALSRDGLGRSCDGHMVTHGDGTYECNSGPDACSGPQAGHQSYTRCGCPPCQDTVPSDLRPSAAWVRRDDGGSARAFGVR